MTSVVPNAPNIRTGPPTIHTGQIVLVAFGGTVIMLFAGFTSAYLIRREGSDWSPVELPATVWINTAVLLASSVMLELATRRRARKLLLVSLGLGLLFLGGQLLAWIQLTNSGFEVGANAHGSFFYMLSGVHALHLLGGLGTMLYVVAKNTPWRLCAIYWHFMGLVWLYVLVLLAL